MSNTDVRFGSGMIQTCTYMYVIKYIDSYTLICWIWQWEYGDHVVWIYTVYHPPTNISRKVAEQKLSKFDRIVIQIFY